jgi:hypothetical protein
VPVNLLLNYFNQYYSQDMTWALCLELTIYKVNFKMKPGEAEAHQKAWIDNESDYSGWSGREDLNFRPQRPERCALTRLRYSP